MTRCSVRSSKEGSSKSYKWMCPSLSLCLFFVSWGFWGIFFFTIGSLFWILFQKTVPLRWLFLRSLGSHSNLLINMLLVLSENTTEIVGFLICLSHWASIKTFQFPVSNSVDFLCVQKWQCSKYFTYIKILFILKNYYYHLCFIDEETDREIE